MADFKVSDALKSLLAVLPDRIKDKIYSSLDFSDMIEVILDLGKMPEIRFQTKVFYLQDDIVTIEDIDHVISNLGSFTADNRAGIARTLHRISAIRNRTGKIIGLTCRVGRAAYGTIDIIKDIIKSNKSILFLGPPGIGKTTKLRESARVLSGELGKRVIVVDTSNEIAGDGDIPHEGIGKARRMQVPTTERQHAVMIEAVENHMPEVIIIDEIGTEAEADAARTIAERGVVLIGTAHGITLENLISNPTLSDLIGGIQTVILGDEEAKRRGTQKAVLERKAPPTFDIVIEIIKRDEMAIFMDTASAVDMVLRGKVPSPEVRIRKETGEIEIKEAQANVEDHYEMRSVQDARPELVQKMNQKTRIYPFGINNHRLAKAIAAVGARAEVVDSVHDANLVLTMKTRAGAGSKVLKLANEYNVPVHVIKSNTMAHIARFLKSHFGLADYGDEEAHAFSEVEDAIDKVKDTGSAIELSPQNAYVRRLQHQLIERFGFKAQSFGEEPNRRVRIFPR